jgi:hypothetical protein
LKLKKEGKKALFLTFFYIRFNEQFRMRNQFVHVAHPAWHIGKLQHRMPWLYRDLTEAGWLERARER